MALTDFVDRGVPSWAKGSNTAHWWGMFRLGAVLIDCLIEGVYQGRKAGLCNAVDLPGIPAYGGFEDTRSLDYIGEDLGVLHGLTEAPPDYAYRCRHAFDAVQGWGAAGLVTGVLEQLAGVLGPNPPLMRLVNRAGDWWTRNQDGTYLLQRVDGTGRLYNADGTTTPDATMAQPWNWDLYNTNPKPGNWQDPGDWYLILYAPLDTPYGTQTDLTFDDPGIVGDLWDDPTTQGPDPGPWAGTVGTNTPICLVELIRSVVAQRSTVGFQCTWIVIANDSNSFKPDGSSTGTNPYPDGWWGYHTRFDAGTNTMVIARNPTAEYWPGACGGVAP
jgi:hypothetical protein